MKKRIVAFIVAFPMSFLCLTLSWAAIVKVEVIHSQDRYQIGETYPILLRLRISKPWYINGTNGRGSGLFPTVLSFHKSPGLKVEEIRFLGPERKKFDYTPEPIEVFSGDMLVRATLVISEDAPTGKQVIKGNLSYQACSPTVCSLPENLPVAIPVFIVPRGTPTRGVNEDIFLTLANDPGASSRP